MFGSEGANEQTEETPAMPLFFLYHRYNCTQRILYLYLMLKCMAILGRCLYHVWNIVWYFDVNAKKVKAEVLRNVFLIYCGRVLFCFLKGQSIITLLSW